MNTENKKVEATPSELSCAEQAGRPGSGKTLREQLDFYERYLTSLDENIRNANTQSRPTWERAYEKASAEYQDLIVNHTECEIDIQNKTFEEVWELKKEVSYPETIQPAVYQVEPAPNQKESAEFSRLGRVVAREINAASWRPVPPNRSREITNAIWLARQLAPDFDAYDLLALARTETTYNPTLVSPTNAKGLMQIMPREFQIHFKKLQPKFPAIFRTPDPFDITQNILVGASVLQTKHDRIFRNKKGIAKKHHTLTSFAAYNCGETKINKNGGRIPRRNETLEHAFETFAYAKMLRKGQVTFTTKAGRKAGVLTRGDLFPDILAYEKAFYKEKDRLPKTAWQYWNDSKKPV